VPIEGAIGSSPMGDAYASKANRAALRGRHRDGIMRKAARNRPLRASEKRFNKLISKRRFRVEQCFGTMKRPLRPAPCPLFWPRQDTRPTGDGRYRAEPAQGHEQDLPQNANPRNISLITVTAKLRPLKSQRGLKRVRF
jgi:IS5 family transposase